MPINHGESGNLARIMTAGGAASDWPMRESEALVKITPRSVLSRQRQHLLPQVRNDDRWQGVTPIDAKWDRSPETFGVIAVSFARS